MDPRRLNRISELLRQSIGEIIEKGLKRTCPGLITITHVKVSPDLSIAWVDFTVIGEEEEAALVFLEHSRYEIMKQLAQKVRLKSLPQLRFFLDPVSKRADKIEELIREIHQNE